MAVTFDASRFFKGLKVSTAAQMEGAVQGMDESGEMVLTLAKFYAPVDKGELKASGVTEKTRKIGGKLVKAYGFGVFYAAAVHEAPPSRKFNKDKNPHARSKYLEIAERKLTDKVGAHVARRIRQRMV